MVHQQRLLPLLVLIISLLSAIASASPFTHAVRTHAVLNSTRVLTGTPTTKQHKSVPSSHSTTPFPITARPTFIYGNDPLSCYPAKVLQTTPNWWGHQSVPNNVCTHKNAHGCNEWNPCSVTIGEVRLLYWPSSMNGSYPSTTYDETHDYIYTYPSIYMIFHTMHAWNSCKGDNEAALGPTMTSAIRAFDLTDISTLVPYSAVGQAGPMKAGQLTLTDLYSDCPSTLSTHSAYTQTHPLDTDPGYRCYPRLAIPSMVEEFGLPWWRSCKIQNTDLGMVDPPYSLTLSGVLAPMSSVDPSINPTAVLITTPLPDITRISSPPAATDPQQSSRPPPSPSSSLQNDLSNLIKDHTSPELTPTPTPAPTPIANDTPHGQPGPVLTVSVAIIDTTIISSSTGEPAIIPVDATPKLENGNADVTTGSSTSGSPLVVTPAATTAPGGQEIVIPSPTFIPIDGASAVLAESIEIIGTPALANGPPAPGSTILVTGLANTVVYLDKTLILGGSVKTVSALNAVLSYGTIGVVAQYPSGIVSTIPVQVAEVRSSSRSGIPSPTSAENEGDEAATIASLIYSMVNGSPDSSVAVTSSVDTAVAESTLPPSGKTGSTGGTQEGSNTTSAMGAGMPTGGSNPTLTAVSSNSEKMRGTMWWCVVILTLGEGILM